MMNKRILGISDSKSVFVPSLKRPEYFELMIKLSGKVQPSICYVGAAKGDNPERIAEFFELANRVDAVPSALKLYSMVSEDPGTYFAGADIIFIDGGITRNLIALMQEWGAIDALVETYEQGTLIAGASAGISMLFEWCVSDSIRTQIKPVRGIGLLKGTVCAHHDTQSERQAVMQDFLEQQPEAFPAYGLEDGVAALFCDGVLETVYTSEPTAKLVMFTRTGQTIETQNIPAVPIAEYTKRAREEHEPVEK